MAENLNQLSEQLLHTVKMQRDSSTLERVLAEQDKNTLFEQLITDDAKKAFWVNVYNAFFQILRKRENKQKPEIYRERLFFIANEPFSLDDVEHGVLRRFKYKYALGYLANPFTTKLIKALAVTQLDYRIHFALNCGAVSCPPIAFYSPMHIEQQLETAALSFLEAETTVIPEKKEVHISTLFKWFLGDFGGIKGIRNMLKQKLNIETEGYRIIYTDYSWVELLDNYKEETFTQNL